MKNIKQYDPSKVNNMQLGDDFRIVCAWYSLIKKGKRFKFTKQQVVNLAKKIYLEISHRVKEGRMKYEFHPEKMKPYARELYEIVSGLKKRLSRDFLSSYKGFTLLFLGTGPANPVIGEGRDGRTNSSLYVVGPNVLIDCTPQVEGQLRRERIDPNTINAVLITHAHADACLGLPKLDKLLAKELTLYAPPRVLQHKRLRRRFEHIVLQSILPYRTTEVYGLKVIPFRVKHAEVFPTGKDFPCYGYRLDDVVYAEDMEGLPERSESYFKGAKVIIVDAAMWFGKSIRGHLNVSQSLELAKKFKPKLLILTQAGRTYPSWAKANAIIQHYWEGCGVKRTRVILAYDGLRINLETLR